jgi:hypothetical protein
MVLDTKGLKMEVTGKVEQWGKLEEKLKKAIPIGGSKITCYRIFWGDIPGFREGEVREELVEWIYSKL